MHYVIVGNGVAGTSAALTLRQREPDAAITMISDESDYFFSRTALMYAFMGRLSLRDLEPYERKVYDVQTIRRIRQRVVDLDAASRRLRLQSGERLSYDRLLLATGSVPRLPSWNGLSGARAGIVHFVSLSDLASCERLTPKAGKAVVAGGGLIGVELVECLAYHGKQVVFLVREPWYWPVALSGEEAGMITEHIRRHGVDVRLNEEISEVLTGAEGQVRGVRTSAGRELACEMLGITIGVRPAVDWLRGATTPPRIGEGVQVGPDFATSLEGVWAAGDCAEVLLPGREPLIEQLWYSAKRQGELAARSMLGDAIRYEPPVFYNSSKFFEIEFTTVGSVVNAPAGSVHFYYRVPGKDISVRIVALENAVIGFNMLGSRWNHVFFERWIMERRSLDYVIRHLHEAQFDVEFGRLNLAPLIEYYGSRRAQVIASGD